MKVTKGNRERIGQTQTDQGVMFANLSYKRFANTFTNTVCLCLFAAAAVPACVCKHGCLQTVCLLVCLRPRRSRRPSVAPLRRRKDARAAWRRCVVLRVQTDRSVGVVVGRAALAGGALWRLRVEDEGILVAIGIILGSVGGLHRVERIRRKGCLWGQRRGGWAGGVGRSGCGAGTRAG